MSTGTVHTPDPTADLNSKYEASSLRVIIGGSVGGFIFSILLCISLVLYCRNRRKHGGLKNGFTVHNGDEEKQAYVVPKRIFLHFIHRVRPKEQHLIVHPMAHSGDYPPPEGKRVLQLDLERHEYSRRESGNGLDSEVNRLRGQIEELTRRMEEFEIIRRDDPEVHAPPDYYSRSAQSPVD
ncbi:hypothetical protein BDZ94DRAFT_1311851 [Collybia nuda]|uniref:Uncharacterized protein n=1 Tax=Collybia nuda TaxID=64659 RepID=A0A9P5XYQ3_9AGAR|nr:hypothetical protein BDZ94DRAFT_1311851 [Collybia nuda]